MPGRNVGLKSGQAKAFVAKGNSQIFLALKNQFGHRTKRQRFRRPLGGNFSDNDASCSVRSAALAPNSVGSDQRAPTTKNESDNSGTEGVNNLLSPAGPTQRPS